MNEPSVVDWANEIRLSLHIPEDFGLGGFPADWEGAIHHVGPRGSSPLKSALVDKTQAGLYAIYSGVMMFAAERLKYHANTTSLRDLAVALFCYQHDASFLKKHKKRPRLLDISRREKFSASVLYFEYAIFYDRWANSGNWPLFPNFAIVAEAITLARHHMGPQQRDIFDPWVEGIIARMNIIAPLPQHANYTWDLPEAEMPAQRRETMGQPIPPQTLDLSVDISGIDLGQASEEFISTVDWSGNSFLSLPGKGTPGSGLIPGGDQK